MKVLNGSSVSIGLNIIFYSKLFIHVWYIQIRIKTLELRESDVSPGKTEVNQGKFVEFISRAKGYSEKLINDKI